MSATPQRTAQPGRSTSTDLPARADAPEKSIARADKVETDYLRYIERLNKLRDDEIREALGRNS